MRWLWQQMMELRRRHVRQLRRLRKLPRRQIWLRVSSFQVSLALSANINDYYFILRHNFDHILRSSSFSSFSKLIQQCILSSRRQQKWSILAIICTSCLYGNSLTNIFLLTYVRLVVSESLAISISKIKEVHNYFTIAQECELHYDWRSPGCRMHVEVVR